MFKENIAMIQKQNRNNQAKSTLIKPTKF